VALTWLAGHTHRIEFGPLVTPVSFRHPAFTARMASAVDDLSGGRLNLGMGAGWQQREHNTYGFDLLEVEQRFQRFEEGLQVVTRLLQSDQPVTLEGRYFQLRQALLLPRPRRPGGPPIVVGGNGRRRTLPLVARYAAEWNATFLTPAKFGPLNAHLDELLQAVGRARSSVRRTMMLGTVFGRDEAALAGKAAGRDLADLREGGVVCGPPAAAVDQLGGLARAGVQRVMLQWLDLDDLDGVELLARSVLPQVSGA
jgi:alkanesulfonate monooxygenase SsuD/methylene tetrahydromethanopterin reductase-like flavin-dependent oxidoreductase (luciferase family)